ncbi:MAG: cytochrome c nitrite reductase small subunit [Myxococcota bacterium]
MRAEWLAGVALGVAVGAAVGIGGFTFGYARGASYLTNDARACANCHIMRDQYDGWLKSSHRAVAACNDCHTPPGFVAKYVTKASNGFWHSYAFTTGNFHEPIQIKATNRAVTESACRHCHADMVDAMNFTHDAQVSCLRCHNNVGHGEPTPSIAAR